MAILQSIADLGGSAPVAAILGRVEAMVGPRLTQADRERLPSGPARWKSNAVWARKHMIQEGLLASSSPRGFWTITDAGRKWLREQRRAPEGADVGAGAFGLKRPARLDVEKARQLMDAFVEEHIDWLKEMAKK